MGRRDKLLAGWRQKPNPEAEVETVEAILSHYFVEGFTKAEGGSHQLRISHPSLYGHPHFAFGMLSIPVKSGQSVRGFYLKRIAEAIAVMQEAQKAEEKNEENKEDIES